MQWLDFGIDCIDESGGTRVEDRLLPINAVLSLLARGNANPALLADLKFELAGLEIPVATSAGTVKIDIVLFRQKDRSILAVEAKAGRNIKNDQARRYGELRPDDVIRAAGISVRVRGERRTLHVVYSVLDENIATIRSQLRALSIDVCLIGVGRQAVRVLLPDGEDAAGSHPLKEIAGFAELGGGILGILPFDHESAIDVIRRAVVAEVVATMSHPQLTHVSVHALTERVCPHVVVFGHAARQILRRRVDEICRRLPAELEGRVEYLPRSEGRDYGALRIVDSPESADPRGRTQRYQAIDRGRERPPTPKPHPGQTELDLFEELDEAGQIGDDGDGVTLGPPHINSRVTVGGEAPGPAGGEEEA
jgi:hypothetical protein